MKKIIFFFIIVLNFFVSADASIKSQIIKNFKRIDNISFNFKQTIGEKKEEGNCIIKYPKKIYCKYNNFKKKIIVSNGKSLVIKNRATNQYFRYPLKKTPLYYLLKKENILNIIKNYEPTIITSKEIEYEIIDENSNKLNIFFDRKSLELAGWKTIDSYSNQVNFVIRNIKTNIFVDNKIFKIPREEDL